MAPSRDDVRGALPAPVAVGAGLTVRLCGEPKLAAVLSLKAQAAAICGMGHGESKLLG